MTLSKKTEAGVRGRFAPSPSGRMHLGNAAAALLSWLSVRSRQGTFVLRMEDLDPQRSHKSFASQILDDLDWLGLRWDEGPDKPGPCGPYRQSERTALYRQQLNRLKERGLIYPCFCSRADLHSAEAPHGTDGELRYGGRCRHLTEGQRKQLEQQRPAALRVMTDERLICFEDGLQGRFCRRLSEQCGDFIVCRSDGVVAYQLAVVVDDALMGINEVVRGGDLLSSTPRQIYLYQQLGFEPPRFVHIPLLVNAQGQRLSKRDHALDLGELRQRYTARELLGHLAALLGMIEQPAPVSAEELIPLFDWNRIRQQVCTVPDSL